MMFKSFPGGRTDRCFQVQFKNLNVIVLEKELEKMDKITTVMSDLSLRHYNFFFHPFLPVYFKLGYVLQA